MFLEVSVTTKGAKVRGDFLRGGDISRLTDRLIRRLALAYADRLRAELRARTPVLTGRLRGSWRVLVQRRGRNYQVQLHNPTPYTHWIFFSPRSPHRGLLQKILRRVNTEFGLT